MSWRFELTDLSGTSLGELRAFQRQFTAGVSQTATATCVVYESDPLWPRVAAGQTKLKVYDSGGNLELFGPIVSDEEKADAGSSPGSGANVTINAVDQSWELTKRYFAKDTTGVGVTYTATDSGAIAFSILASINADQATGIAAGNADAFVTRSVTYLFKQALQAITELGGIEGSFEWALRYVDVSGLAPGVFLDLHTQLGSDRTTSVFLEYGTGKNNIQSYDRVRAIDQQATRVWALGSGSTQSSQAFDSAAESVYQARREDVVSYGDISATSLLSALAAANVAIRKDPYATLQLTTLAATSPSLGVDYVVGDYLAARVVINQQTRVNGAVRVWGVQISIDELGNETTQFVLQPQQGVV